MNTPSPAEQRGTKPTQASAHLANATTRDYTDTAREFVDKLNLAEQPATASLPKAHMPVTSIMLLGNARDIQETRARDYDQPGGERSMEATVQAFNIITRRSGELALTESEGWLLMQILKDVRDRSTARPHRDSLEDGISYSSLKAEARLRENQGEM